MFAKIYDTTLGQILVKIENRVERSEIKIYFELEKHGVCSIDMFWDEEDKTNQYKKALYTFYEFDELKCYNIVKTTINKLGLNNNE